MLNKKALAASVSAAVEATYVEDVFSTYLYGGNGSSNPGQTITNGIDLLNEGGLVWIKNRGNTYGHRLFDSARSSKYLDSSSTAESLAGLNFTRTTSGFTIKDVDFEVNATNEIYTSWTFRKAAKFFDVVTYTGDGVAGKTINHNLGSVPGCIIVKRTDSTGTWAVYHRGLDASVPEQYGLRLDLTNARFTPAYWNDTAPTSTQFTLNSNSGVNASGGTYVAYLFAHDESAFGDNSDQDIIQCGQYTGNGSTQTITLGWEPQWILIKAASGDTAGSQDWVIFDNLRGMALSTVQPDFFLNPNRTYAETATTAATNAIAPVATGFYLESSEPLTNQNGNTYIYIAIRRGPMKTPTDATKVFTPTVYTGTNVDNRLINTTIAPDFVMIRQRNDTVVPGMYTGARLTGQEFLITGSTNAGATDADSFDAQNAGGTERGNAFSSMSGVWVGNDATRKFNANTTSNNHIIEAFKRAPGFFDVVCYTGTGTNTTVSHNLGVAPEMMWVKRRGTTTRSWAVYANPITATDFLSLDLNSARGTDSSYWNNTEPTSSVFTVNNTQAVNASASTYIALLFASCPGVSKVGSYTGNGTSQTIDCGFTAGARYVLIKRTDSTGDWFVYDSARGIVSGNDPQLKLNATTAEATGFDAIDPDNSGFIVNEDATNFPINTNNATYIYLAIA